MSDLTAKFTALREQLANEATEADTDRNVTNIKLQSMLDLLDVIIVNNAANTKALLAAIGQSSACMPCPLPSLTVPPTDATGRPIDEDKCKRTQAFLHAMTEVFTVLDVMSSFGVGFSPTAINEAITQVITALANSDTTPLPSWPEAVQIAGSGINYAASNVLVGDSLVELWAPLVPGAKNLIYGSGSAAGAQTAYETIISGSSSPGYAKQLMIDAAYNELFSYYFDPASEPNLTGYSGTACSFPLADITECIDMESYEYVTGSDTYYVVIGDPVYSGNPIFTSGDFYGFTFELLSLEGTTNVRLDYYDVSSGYSPGDVIDATMEPYTQTVHTTAMGIHSNFPNIAGPFVVRICPPVEE